MFQVVVRLGFEPRQGESESPVLPLHHRTVLSRLTMGFPAPASKRKMRTQSPKTHGIGLLTRLSGFRRGRTLHQPPQPAGSFFPIQTRISYRKRKLRPLVRVGDYLDTIQPKEDQPRTQDRPLIPIHKRVVFTEIEQVCRPYFFQVNKRGTSPDSDLWCSDRRLEQGILANARASAEVA